MFYWLRQVEILDQVDNVFVNQFEPGVNHEENEDEEIVMPYGDDVRVTLNLIVDNNRIDHIKRHCDITVTVTIAI